MCLLSHLNIVHNDLKPENILIKHNDFEITELKISDFGSAHIFGTQNTARTATPEYMTPENLLN